MGISCKHHFIVPKVGGINAEYNFKMSKQIIRILRHLIGIIFINDRNLNFEWTLK